MLATKPLAYLEINMMVTSTKPAMPTPVKSAYLGLGILGNNARSLGMAGNVEPGALAAAAAASNHCLCSGLTMLGAVGPTGLPKIQLMPMRIKLIPITAMMVPVTTGGKNLSMRLTTGAMRMEITPAPMIDPKIN